MLKSHDNNLSIQIIQNNTITDDADKKIRLALAESFPHNSHHFQRTRKWFSEAEWNVIVFSSDEHIAGFMAVIERIISIGSNSQKIKIFGPQNVMVAPQWRKTGVVREMMNTAVSRAEQDGIEAGLLFCRKPLADKVYGPLGWKEIHDTVYVNRNQELKIPRPSHDLAMMYPLSVTEFPPGDIDLYGPDW